VPVKGAAWIANRANATHNAAALLIIGIIVTGWAAGWDEPYGTACRIVRYFHDDPAYG
jgi:hypothetical protein